MEHSRLLAVLLAGMLLSSGLRTVQAESAQRPASLDPLRAIYAGMDNGAIYRSSDGGGSWQEADSGLTDEGSVYALAVTSTGVVYAGTRIGGVFTSKDGGRHWSDANGGKSGPGANGAYGLAVDPKDDRRIFALDGYGGFYRSDDGARTWTKAATAIGRPNSLIIDKGRPTTLAISGFAQGMLLSTDGGASWVHAAGFPKGASVVGLAFSPTNPDVAFAATDAGMYQSIDGGHTWQPERRGIPKGTALGSVVVDPNSPTTVIAGGADGQIYRSTDGGTSWKVVDSASGQITALLFDPAHPGTVLAGSESGSNLYVSGDAGVNWRQSNPGLGDGNWLWSLAFAPRPPLPTDAVNPPHPQKGLRYFANTYHTLREPFLDFWNAHGGAAIFGAPLTEAFVERGQTVQYFERARLVVVGGVVTISPLGALLTAGRHFATVKPFTSTSKKLYFPDTKHSLAGQFLQFWQQHGGAAVLGSPISEPLHEQNGDGTGRRYLLQYFQNARLEYHPELAGTPYAITLGLIGRQYLQRRGWVE